MHAGGVYLNWGSAVLLPEVFLKAVSVVRNLGVPLQPITTANFDFIQHYRPIENVVKRPTAASNAKKGESLPRLRHHRPSRTSLPLLAAALVAGWPAQGKRAKQMNSFRRDSPATRSAIPAGAKRIRSGLGNAHVATANSHHAGDPAGPSRHSFPRRITCSFASSPRLSSRTCRSPGPGRISSSFFFSASSA